jgi:hypothetical protein
MAPHIGLKNIQYLGLAKKQKLIVDIVQHYIKQYIQKLRTHFSVFLRKKFQSLGKIHQNLLIFSFKMQFN